MEVKKLTYGILTTIIAVMLVSAMLIPVLPTPTTHTVEKENVGYMYTATDQPGNYTYSITDSTLYINGDELQISGSNAHPGAAGKYFWFALDTVPSGATILEVNPSEAYTTATSSKVIMTPSYWNYYESSDLKVGSNIYASTFGFAAVNGGDYAVYDGADASFSVNTGEAVHYYSQLAYGSSANLLRAGDAEGSESSAYLRYTYSVTIVDGVATLEYAILNNGGTVEDITSSVTATCTYSSMTTDNGLTTYTGLNVELTGLSLDTTYNCFAVPLKYTVTEISGNGPEYTLINIIPLLVLVGVMLGAVGLFISRRD